MLFLNKLETKTLGEIRNEIRRISLDCWDMPNLEGSTLVASHSSEEGSDFLIEKVVGEKDSFSITDLALSQMCNKLGLPLRYFRRLNESDSVMLRSLALENLNQLLANYDKPFMLRMYQNKIRGVLSERFSNFDAPEIMDVICDKVRDEDFVIRGCQATYEDFHIRLTSARPFKIANFDKDVYFGMQITSSDVGKSALNINAFLWKQVCTNGMCVPMFDRELFRQKHIGIDVDVFNQGLIQSLKVLPTLKNRIEDLLSNAGSVLIDKDIFDTETSIGKAFKEYTLLPKEAMRILEEKNKHYSNTKTAWSVASALTEYAQEEGVSFDRRLMLEKIAGDFVGVAYKKFLA